MPTMWEKRVFEEEYHEGVRKLDKAGAYADPYKALGVTVKKKPRAELAPDTSAVTEKENATMPNTWSSYLFGGQAGAAKTTPAPPPAAAKAAAPVPKAEKKAEAPTAPAAEAAPADAAIDCTSGNAAQGAALFKAKCATCHTSNDGGPNKSGPNLFGVMGRGSGQVAGFSYTPANKSSGITWDNESMFQFLTNPKKFIKGTNMAFPGFKKEQDRADVIAYLNTLR